MSSPLIVSISFISATVREFDGIVAILSLLLRELLLLLPTVADEREVVE